MWLPWEPWRVTPLPLDGLLVLTVQPALIKLSSNLHSAYDSQNWVSSGHYETLQESGQLNPSGNKIRNNLLMEIGAHLLPHFVLG